MKKIRSILVIFILTFVTAYGQDNYKELIRAANNAYNEGAYQEAKEKYLEVAGQGYTSAALYYNLGNACFKTNDIPAAILYYEKALKIDPTDEDVQYNLNIANSMKVDKIEEVPDLFYILWWDQLSNLFRANTWAWISAATFLLVFIMATVFVTSVSVRARRSSFWTGILFLFLFVIATVISYQEYVEYTRDDQAIVFTPTLTVRSSPMENSVDLFVIHEGTKVTLIDEVEGWAEIRIANGSTGWIPRSSFRVI
ncbi:MAG: tetratricopeptide repeat protein [Bacteroidales bacterium]